MTISRVNNSKPKGRRTGGVTGERRTSFTKRHLPQLGRVSLILTLVSVVLSGCVSDPLDKVINQIDKTRTVIESLSTGWREEIPKLVSDLNGLESQVASDAKSVVADATNQIQDLADQTIQLSDAKAQDLIAQAGVEFRCNADFVKAGVVAALHHFVDDLKFWQQNKKHLDRNPNHFVCWINPTVLSLYPSENRWFIDPSNMSDKAIVRVFGYSFRPDAVPVVELRDASGQKTRDVNLNAAYVTSYQINLDLSREDFKGIQSGARLVFRWPDREDPNTINLTLRPAAALKLSNPVFTPASPTATTEAVSLKVTVTNKGGSRSGNFIVNWKPDVSDPRILAVSREPLNPGEPAEIAFPGYVYQRSGAISGTVSLSNGDDTQTYPVTVTAPPVTKLPEKDLPGFPQQPSTVYGKFIGGFGLDAEYGGDCTLGYVRKTAQVIVIDSRGPAAATFEGWTDPNNPKNCKIRVHYSIGYSAPNPNPNYVTVKLVIREEGE